MLSLSNQEILRDEVISIVDLIVTRIKLLNTDLPCINLFQLVRQPDCCCDLSLRLLSVCLEYEKEQRKKDYGHEFLASLGSFEDPFSSQSNILCNLSLLLLNSLPFIATSNNYNSSSRPCIVLFDWFLDIFMVKKEFRKGSVGSIQAGFSEIRVNRLCWKYDSWSDPMLKLTKRNVMEIISPDLMAYPILLALLLCGCCDSNTEIAQFSSKKLNLYKNTMDKNKYCPIEVIKLLLCLCKRTPKGISDEFWIYEILTSNRSCLRSDIRICILKWVSKEVSELKNNECASLAAEISLSVCLSYQEDISALPFPLQAQFLALLCSAESYLTNEQLQNMQQGILTSIVSILSPFAARGAVDADTDAESVREV